MTRGVVYVATGQKCYDEAVRSARSVKRHNPGLPITVFSEANRTADCFDAHLLIDNPIFQSGDKVLNILRSPYERTLFLDSDTFVTCDLFEYFDILDRFEFAGAHEVARGFWYSPKSMALGIPDSFAELNSGVFSFRRGERTEKLFRDWVTYYEQDRAAIQPGDKGRLWDQPSLRRALWDNSEVKICTLPTEFNALRNWGTYLWGKARVIHGRGNVDRIAHEMNEFQNVERVYLQQFGMIPRMDRVSSWINLRIWLRFNAALLLVFWRRISKRWKL